MKVLLVLGLLVATVAANFDSTGNNVPQFAEGRETSYDNFDTFESQPITYSTGGSFYAGNDLSNGGGFFFNDLISTGLNIVLGVFFFSLIIQIVSKVLDSDLFPNLLDTGRGMSSSEIINLTNMAMEAYQKYEQMNTPK